MKPYGANGAFKKIGISLRIQTYKVFKELIGLQVEYMVLFRNFDARNSLHTNYKMRFDTGINKIKQYGIRNT
jgi:hypothetical protein